MCFVLQPTLSRAGASGHKGLQPDDFGEAALELFRGPDVDLYLTGLSCDPRVQKEELLLRPVPVQVPCTLHTVIFVRWRSATHAYRWRPM